MTASTKNELRDLSGWTLFGAVASVGGRILLSAIFLVSGFGKIAAPAGAIAYIAAAGLPFPQFAYGIAVVLEIVGGLALIAGYRTRFVAAALDDLPAPHAAPELHIIREHRFEQGRVKRSDRRPQLLDSVARVL